MGRSLLNIPQGPDLYTQQNKSLDHLLASILERSKIKSQREYEQGLMKQRGEEERASLLDKRAHDAGLITTKADTEKNLKLANAETLLPHLNEGRNAFIPPPEIERRRDPATGLTSITGKSLNDLLNLSKPVANNTFNKEQVAAMPESTIAKLLENRLMPKDDKVPSQQFTVIDDNTGAIESLWMKAGDSIPQGKTLHSDFMAEKRAHETEQASDKRQSAQDEQNKIYGERANRTAEISIFSRYQDDPDVKAHSKISAQVKNMAVAYNGALKDPNKLGSSDRIIGVTMQKMIEPDSVVMLGEFAMTTQGQSLLDRAKGYTQSLAEGGLKLSPNARKAMYETAKELFREYEAQAKLKNKQYKDMAILQGLNPKVAVPQVIGIDFSKFDGKQSGVGGMSTEQLQARMKELKNAKK